MFRDSRRYGRPTEDYAQGRSLTRQTVMRSPKRSWKEILAILRLEGTAVRPSTVSRRPNKQIGLKFDRAARKPHLTPMTKKMRLNLDRCHRHWILVEWIFVFYECTMQQFVPRYMSISWPLGKRFDKKYVVATMKHPPTEMIWGAVALLVCSSFRLPPLWMDPNAWNCSQRSWIYTCTSMVAWSLDQMGLLVTDQR